MVAIWPPDRVWLRSGHLTVCGCRQLTGASSLRVPKSAWSPHKIQSGWEVSPGANNVFGAAKSAGDTATIKYLGSYNSTEECEAAATVNTLCMTAVIRGISVSPI